MDEIKKFFTASGGPKPVTYRGSVTGGMHIVKDEDILQQNHDDAQYHETNLDTGYEHVEEARQLEKEQKNRAIYNKMQSMEKLSTQESTATALNELPDEALTAVYKKYSFKREVEGKFDINEYKQVIFKRLEAHRVVIIQGPTGCGKTTQVPQWILDSCYENKEPCKIVVTQPRRIAAISIAKRVAQERGWDVGGVVGYQIGLDCKTSSDTLIQYVTTGVLLQRLVATKTLGGYTHIIIDEVHERNKDMDFLLLVIKKLLRATPEIANIKVILMSATFDVNKFTDYFTSNESKEYAGSVTIEKKDPTFHVKEFYSSQLHKFRNLEIYNDKHNPTISKDTHTIAVKLLNTFDYIDQHEDHYNDDQIPSVLIFLPGIYEIDELYNLLHDSHFRHDAGGNEYSDRSKWWVLPLHSVITPDEQIKVFQRAPAGYRKIILSTNIAESSITVPDIKYVIDYCLMKVLVVDDNTNFPTLKLQWASKTNCRQRSGRAGRVRDGRVYRLISQNLYDDLDVESEPEMKRSTLDNLILLAKLLDMGSPSHVLGLAMDPPDLSNIHRSILQLKEVGCLKKTLNGVMAKLDGDITYLGRICAKLPLDVRMSKMIVLGHIFGCLDECIIMAGAMSLKSIFSNPFQNQLNSYNSRLTWADGSTSDPIAMYNVYKVWTYLHKNNQFKMNKGAGDERNWARRFFVQSRVLKELDILSRELYNRLSYEKIASAPCASPWNKNEKILIMKIIIAGAFYPHYYYQPHEESREREALKVLAGHDPRTTVYLLGFPFDQPGKLYSAPIKNTIRNLIGDEPKVIFDNNSSKIFLTFSDNPAEQTQMQKGNTSKNPMIPGKVLLPVYKAVKARTLKMDIVVNMLPKAKAQSIFNELNKRSNTSGQMVPKLPAIDDTYIPIKISQFINCGRFWAQMDDGSTTEELLEIDAALNNASLLANTATVKVGDLFAAPYEDKISIRMYRVRVQKLLPNNMVLVFYIDFGSLQRLNVASLRVLPRGLCWEKAPLAMECVLTEVSPSLLNDLHGKWTPEATQFFQSLVSNKRLHGKIYSVCHGVVSIYLFVHGGKLNVNDELVKRKFAQAVDESYESKLNHDLRVSANDLNMSQKRAHNQQQMELARAFQETPELEPPASSQCSVSVKLKGPTSPLECTVYPLMHGSKTKNVTIDHTSVNSVLIDTEPQSPYDRLLVAATVGRNEKNTNLTLRHTTLMPAIPGLPAIIAMIFCPTMELRCDVNMTRYVSALCGLGTTESGVPLYPEHDMLVNLDVDIDGEDIREINYIRHSMDKAMFCVDGCEDLVLNEANSKIAITIRDSLFKLFGKHRTHREKYAVRHEWEWSMHMYNEMNVPNDPCMESIQMIYPLHSYPVLKPTTNRDLIKMKSEAEILKTNVAGGYISLDKVFTCKLCGTDPMTSQVMRIHLYSKTHNDREKELENLLM